MAILYVPSTIRAGTARGPRLALIVHMAEGGGTVEHLSGADPRGVSVHYVIRYSGELVRMLALTDMHTSIRTSAIRTTNDPAYSYHGQYVRYGATAAWAVMREWATTARTLGPNHASIAVELEGFASRGPNAAQVATLTRLWRYLLTKYPTMRALGHRDFADYKACPGHRLPWEAVDGHGKPAAVWGSDVAADIRAAYTAGAVATRLRALGITTYGFAINYIDLLAGMRAARINYGAGVQLIDVRALMGY